MGYLLFVSQEVLHPKRTPEERVLDHERGLKLDPLDMPEAELDEARSQVLATLRRLSATAREGWVDPNDLFEALYDEGWPYPDPNCIISGMKDMSEIEREFQKTPDSHGPVAHFVNFYRLAPVSVGIRPGVRSRCSDIAAA